MKARIWEPFLDGNELSLGGDDTLKFYYAYFTEENNKITEIENTFWHKINRWVYNEWNLIDFSIEDVF